MGKRTLLNFFSTKDTLGISGIAEASVERKKIKEITKLQKQHANGEISDRQYKKFVRDIKRI